MLLFVIYIDRVVFMKNIHSGLGRLLVPTAVLYI